MADVNHIHQGNGVFLWAGLGASETGDTLSVNGTGGIAAAVQMTGTFGGTVTLQGSLDGTTWAALKDTQGTAVEATAAGLYELSTGVAYIRPSSGSGVSDVDVYIRLTRG